MKEDVRCVLTLPLLTEPFQEHIIEKRFKIAEHLQNSLIAMELRRYHNIEHKKEYQEIQRMIKDTPSDKRKSLYKQRRDMLRQAGFSEFAFKDDMTNMQKHFPEHIAAHVAHKLATNVWRSFDKFLYGNGQKVHFRKKGSLTSIANQKNGNAMKYSDGIFVWSGARCENSIKLRIKVANPRTSYEKEMLQKEIKYLRVIRKWIKTRYKYYLQITLVGQPVEKDKELDKGRVGIDIGTQSIAIVSGNDVKLLELADKVNDNHKKLLKLQRKMDVSRRITNPYNYNEDGTIKKGVKLVWNKSNKYKKLAGKVRELQRKNADIRKYQHFCLANYILSLGDEVYIEDMNYQALQRRAKETKKDDNGKYKRKKRFGKSLANKAPSMFIEILDMKLKVYKGRLIKVDTREFRASQYDHLSQKYNKKKLSQRIHFLSNGDNIQRDLYSAFLIMNSDEDLKHTNLELCELTYNHFKKLHDDEIARICSAEGKILSSFGIAI